MKFYKITNKEEKHYEMQYKTGLNTDIIKFNPSGDCETGGIYFSREHILAFLEYGCWIREVVIPDGMEIYRNPGDPIKWKAHQVILKKRYKITAKKIEQLILDGADVHADNDCALRWASESGHLNVVKVLLEAGADVHVNNDYALIWASSRGHLGVVKVLLENGADVHAKDDCALRWASRYGLFDVVKVLLENGANVHADNDCALKWASRYGYLDVVKVLQDHMKNTKGDPT